MTQMIKERALNHGTPLVDGEAATFVWLGEHAPDLIGDFTDWDNGKPAALTQAEPGVWTFRLVLPSDAYIEYVFYDQGSRVSDPNNTYLTYNGMGKYNHYFYMPAGNPTPLVRQPRNVPRGTLKKIELRSNFYFAGGRRAVHLYQPEDGDEVPLIVVYDGSDYLRRAKLTKVIDALIANGQITPVAMAFIDNGGSSRGLEYACSEATIMMIIQEILPLAQTELNLLDINQHPGAYGVLGASMGGLMALYTGLRLPHIFGKVISQSGAFSFGDYDTIVFDLVRWGDMRPIKIWMDVGIFDMPLLLAANRRMKPLLKSRGYPVSYREYPAGHNYPAWRDDIWHGLVSLFVAQ